MPETVKPDPYIYGSANEVSEAMGAAVVLIDTAKHNPDLTRVMLSIVGQHLPAQ